MIKNMSDQLKEMEIALLQLQRSALIDTQTVMQLMIDKGICDTEDIVNTRRRIENESPDIRRVDEQIEGLGGAVMHTPVPDAVSTKDDLKKQLQELLKQLGDASTL